MKGELRCEIFYFEQRKLALTNGWKDTWLRLQKMIIGLQQRNRRVDVKYVDVKQLHEK